MGRVLKIVGKIWIALAATLILGSYFMIAVNQGFEKLTEILSPFNFLNLIAVVFTLAPGLLAIHFGEKIIQAKQRNRYEE